MDRASIKILLVDDDENFHLLIRDMLVRAGKTKYQLDYFSNYDHARKAIVQNHYHVCLIDYCLGQKNGLDLICETSHSGEITPMILLTGYDDPEIAVRSLHSGVCDHLLKTKLTPDLLERSIRYVIEQKQIQQQLRLTQFSVDCSSEMVFWVGPDGQFIYVNNAVCRALGYSRETMLTMNVFDIDCIFTKEQWDRHWRQLREQGNHTFETMHRTRDGRTIPVEINANYMCYAGQEYNFAFVRDISEHKLSQQRLSQALMRFEALIKNVPMVAIQGFDPQGVIRHWNSYSEKVFELASNEVIGHRFQDILLDEQQGCDFTAMLEQIQKTKSSYPPREMQINTCDDQSRWMYSVAFPVFDNDEISEIFCVGVDITELKQTQKENALARDQAEYMNHQLEISIERANALALQARVSNEAKGSFLANMSHEIRTPLHAIVGFGDLLAEESITPEQKEYVRLIRTAGKNLLELINDILDFSKIEAGKLDVRIVECSLEEILGELKSLMEQAAAKKHLDFQILPDSNLPAIIHSDPARLRQCLVNLINNAIKFTEQGHVHVRVRLQEGSGESWICFEVADSGIGISSEAQEKIFDMFSQADDGITRRFGGTGLGLAITEKLSSLLGGDISVKSTQGEGSTFILTLPIGADARLQPRFRSMNISVASVHRNAVRNEGYRGHILVAEDNLSSQLLIHKLLGKMGLQVSLVADGEQAVGAAIEGDYDLVLMDIQMPKVDGCAATRLLREKQYNRPIIALTASAMKGDREQCLQAGCDDYLTKPINSKELRRIMDKYLKNNSTPGNDRSSAEQTDGALSPFLSADEPIVSELADDPDLCEVAQMFIDELPETMKKIQESFQQKDLKALKFLLHSLKGSSGSAGFPVLMAKAADMESQVLQEELENLQNELDEMNALFSRAISRSPS